MRPAIVVLLGVALCVGSQIAKAQEEEKRALAEELLNAMHMKETTEKSIAIVKNMMPQISKMAQKSSEEDDEDDDEEADEQEKARPFAEMHSKIMDKVFKEMSWDSMKEDYITIYAETYTKDELEGLITFYKSPVGQAFVEKQPELMKRSMQLTQKRMAKWMPKIRAKTEKMMKTMKDKQEKEE